MSLPLAQLQQSAAASAKSVIIWAWVQTAPGVYTLQPSRSI